MFQVIEAVDREDLQDIVTALESKECPQSMDHSKDRGDDTNDPAIQNVALDCELSGRVLVIGGIVGSGCMAQVLIIFIAF